MNTFGYFWLPMTTFAYFLCFGRLEPPSQFRRIRCERSGCVSGVCMYLHASAGACQARSHTDCRTTTFQHEKRGKSASNQPDFSLIPKTIWVSLNYLQTLFCFLCFSLHPLWSNPLWILFALVVCILPVNTLRWVIASELSKNVLWDSGRLWKTFRVADRCWRFATRGIAKKR